MHGLIATTDGGGLAGGASVLIILAIVVIVWIGWWKVFEKAGEAGWKALIPIYNVFVLTKIVGRPWWWVLLLLIPCVGIVIAIMLMNDLSKSFGKGTGFTIGLILLTPIFSMILGYGDSKYLGPAGAGGATQPAT